MSVKDSSLLNKENPHPYAGKYVLVRTYASGVHFGILKDYDFNTRHIYLTKTRRIWYWEGAFTLSAVATNGIKDGKLSIEIPEIMVSQVEEIIICSSKAEENLKHFIVHNP